MTDAYQTSSFKSYAKTRTATAVRKIAAVPWLRYMAVRVLNRVPFVKHRLQRLLATVPQDVTLFVREEGNKEDYLDRLQYSPSAFKLASLARKYSAQTSDTATVINTVCITGHFDGSYSLASVNRQLALRLQNDCSAIDCFIEPYEGAPKDRVSYVPGDARDKDKLNQQLYSAVEESVDVRIFHHYPLIKPTKNNQKMAVALFFWEESLVKRSLIEQLNQWYDAVIVTAWSVKKALIDSGCLLPIEIVALPLIAKPNADSLSDSAVLKMGNTVQDNPITLLHVSSCFPRKGVDVLLEAFDQVTSKYPEAFKLVIKTFPNPHNQIDAWVDRLIAPEHLSKIEIINEDYTEQQMAKLYGLADVVVLPARGEGLNLPAIEAGHFKRPVLVTDYGAHTDFTPADELARLRYRFSHSQSHVAEEDSLWVDVSTDDLVQKLDRLLKRDESLVAELSQQASVYQQTVQTLFYGQQAAHSFLSSLNALSYAYMSDKTKMTQKVPVNLCIVSSWDEDCGIAEYSQCIVDQWLKLGNQVSIAAPYKKGRLSSDRYARIHVQENWDYGSEPDLVSFETEQDVVWLQHHFAFYALGVTLMTGVKHQVSKGKLVAITLHTTRPLLAFEGGHLETAVVCLREFSQIFVHTLDDINTLKRLGVLDNVTLMPHGIHPVKTHQPKSKETDAPFTVGSFGFLLPHKGLDVLIEAFAQLVAQEKIPKTSRLRLVNAVRQDGVSNYEKQRCEKIASKQGVKHLVDWHSDFLPSDVVEGLLEKCDMLVLPYQHTLESSSGAVRNAVSACPHVATTPAPIFDEMRSITHGIQGYDVPAVAKCIQHFYSSMATDEFLPVLKRREEWLAMHTWPSMAQRYQAIFKSRIVQEKCLIQQKKV